MKRSIVHTLVPIVIASLLNAYIYLVGWNDSSRKQDNSKEIKLLPPGYAIAIIWVIILGLLGYTHSIVYPSFASWIIVLAIIYCIAYPFLTNGLKMDNSKLLNLFSFIIAIIVMISVGVHSGDMTVIYIVPFVIWTLYVNIITNVNI